jgi:hypothetical protein
MRLFLLFIFIGITITSCLSPKETNAQDIIDKSIEVSGGDLYKNLDFEFEFRGRHYISNIENGDFEYTRVTKDSVKTTVDTYGNKTPFKRTINDISVTISDSIVENIKNSINSVNYFVLLPNGLNDAAVNKKYIAKATVKGREYHKIQVTFNKDGGGEDFDDVYLYWINAENFKIDFLAYSFTVNGGGMRFREAYNERVINGIRFVDYNNYKSEETSATLNTLDVLFESNQLKLLSKIETEQITLY